MSHHDANSHHQQGLIGASTQGATDKSPPFSLFTGRVLLQARISRVNSKEMEAKPVGLVERGVGSILRGQGLTFGARSGCGLPTGRTGSCLSARGSPLTVTVHTPSWSPTAGPAFPASFTAFWQHRKRKPAGSTGPCLLVDHANLNSLPHLKHVFHLFHKASLHPSATNHVA